MRDISTSLSVCWPQPGLVRLCGPTEETQNTGPPQRHTTARLGTNYWAGHSLLVHTNTTQYLSSQLVKFSGNIVPSPQ